MNDTDSQDRVSKYDGSYVLVMPDGLAFYWQPIEATNATPELIKEHKAKGWLTLRENDYRIMTLQSMHANMHGLGRDENDRTIWVQAHKLVEATDVPVTLASRLDRKRIGEAIGKLDDDAPIFLSIINPLPLPDWGTVGVIWRDETNITSIALEALPPEGLRLQQEIRALILDTSLGTNLLWTYTEGEPGEEIKQAALAMRASIEADEQAYNETCKQILIKAGELAKMYLDYYTHNAVSIEPSISKKKLPAIPNIFTDKKALTLTAQPTIAALEAISAGQSAPQKWKALGGYPTFTHKVSSGTTHVQVKDESLTGSDNVDKLMDIVLKMKDTDGDVLIALISQILLGSKLADGSVWIHGDAILDYRDIEPIQRKDGEDKPITRHGHRFERKQEIADSIARLTKLWITVNQIIKQEEAPARKRGEKSKIVNVSYKRESKLIHILEIITRKDLAGDNKEDIEKDDPEGYMPVAWRFTLGTWAEAFLVAPNRQTGYIGQAVLKYDPNNHKWEKRLARYFFFHMRINHHAVALPYIGKLLERLHLRDETEERDHPARYKVRLEKALNTLVKDKCISAWEYKDKSQPPARNWLLSLLENQIVVMPVPTKEDSAKINDSLE